MTLPIARIVSGFGDLEVAGSKHGNYVLPRYSLLRVNVTLSLLVTLLVVWLEPSDILHRLISMSGPSAWHFVAALCLISCIAFVDWLVNDVMPARFQFPWAKHWRGPIYMAQALGAVLVAAVLCDTGGMRPVVLPLVVDAIFTVLVAYLDIFHRFRAAAQ